MKKEYRDATGRVDMVIDVRWYDPLVAVAFTSVFLLMKFQPIQKLIRHQRLIRFCVVGGISTVAALIVLWLMTDVVGVYYLGSSLIAAVVSTAIWFTGNATWTFGDRKTTGWSVPKTALVRVAAIGLHTALLALFVEVFGVWYIVGAMLAILIEFMLSYLLSSKWIWRYEQSRAAKAG